MKKIDKRQCRHTVQQYGGFAPWTDKPSARCFRQRAQDNSLRDSAFPNVESDVTLRGALYRLDAQQSNQLVLCARGPVDLPARGKHTGQGRVTRDILIARPVSFNSHGRARSSLCAQETARPSKRRIWVFRTPTSSHYCIVVLAQTMPPRNTQAGSRAAAVTFRNVNGV